MKIYELFENEDRTPNLNIRVVHGDWNQERLFIEASARKDDSPDWLRAAKGTNPVVAVEVTVDLDHSQKIGYINHILSHQKGRGYAPETLKWIAKKLKEKGFESVMCYIENSNFSSRSMVEKAGFKQMKQEKHGAYFGKALV